MPFLGMFFQNPIQPIIIIIQSRLMLRVNRLHLPVDTLLVKQWGYKELSQHVQGFVEVLLIDVEVVVGAGFIRVGVGATCV